MGGDDEVADQGELQAASRADPVDSRDSDRHEVVDDIHGFLIHADVPGTVIGGEVKEAFDVVAGAEGVARSAQDQHPAVTVDGNIFDGRVEFCRDFLIEGVVDLGAVQCDCGDRAVVAHDQLAGRR